MKTLNKRIVLWLVFIVCFAGIPALLFTVAYMHTASSYESAAIDDYVQKFEEYYASLRLFSDEHAFWAHYLLNHISRRVIPRYNHRQTLERRLKQIAISLPVEYLVFNEDELLFSSFEFDCDIKWHAFMSGFYKNKDHVDFNLTEAEVRAIEQIAGSQIVLKHIPSSRRSILADSNYEKPYIWANDLYGDMIVVFIPPDKVDSNEIIDSSIKALSKEAFPLQFATYQKEKGINIIGNTQYSDDIEMVFQTYSNKGISRINTTNIIAFPRFLKPDIYLAGFVDSSVIIYRLDFIYYFGFFALLLYSIFLAGYSYNLIVKQSKDTISISWKLRYLLFFANAVPLIVLFYTGNEYLDNRREELLKEIHGQAVDLLKNYDLSLQTELHTKLIAKQLAEKRLVEQLKVSELTDDIMLEFTEFLEQAAWYTILIASSTERVGTNLGVYDRNKNIIPEGATQEFIGAVRFVVSLGRYLLAYINRTPFPERDATELELFVESLTMQPKIYLLNRLVTSLGGYVQWGFGDNIHPAMVDTYSVHGSDQDYFFMSVFRDRDFQDQFVDNTVLIANRNELGLSIVAVEPLRSLIKPERFSGAVTLYDFAAAVTAHPNKELRFVDIDNKEYLAVGFIGAYISRYALVGLYDVSRIDTVLASQRQTIYIFAVLSLVVTLILSQALAQGFIEPIGHLNKGATAIKDRKFNYRLPNLGRDEFGQMGNVFNEVMVDLHELSAAATVQEELLPTSELCASSFSFFGQSVPMNELGGDYVDYFKSNKNDQHLCCLMGDVAGHGVGAALIMAMAKAGVVYKSDLHNQPAKLLASLHKMIYGSKTKKQRKIMTFQYLFVNNDSSEALYSNAGGCFPIHVKKSSNTATEIDLSGAALGSFKKAVFNERKIKFEKNDALIFYTDGIIETRDPSGKELGYERFKQILLDSWDSDAKVYYNNIYSHYTAHLGDQPAQDDVTLLIMVYTG